MSSATDNRLLEFVAGEKAAPADIDRAAGVIRGVKVLGESSRNPPPNNHLYPEATRRAAISLFEGRQVCVDHPAPDQAGAARSYTAGMGLIRNVREGGNGLYGDWHFPPKHPLAESVFWDVENLPRGPGFSINGHAGAKRHTDAGMVVESIESLVSIDLVSRPATTAGLRESMRPPMKHAVKQLIESLKATRPGYSRALKEMAEAGLMSPDSTMDAPAGDAPAGDAGAGVDHIDAILTAAAACLRDDSLDSAAKMSKIKKLLAMTEKDEPGPKGEPCPPDKEKKDDPAPKGGKGGKGGKGDDDEDSMESLKLQLRSRDLLMEASIRPDKVLLKALAGCKDEAEVKELIEASKGRGQAPRSGYTPPPAAGTLAEAKIPEKAADWGLSLVE